MSVRGIDRHAAGWIFLGALTIVAILSAMTPLAGCRRVCDVGAVRCNDNRAQVCDSSGAWLTYQDCDETTPRGVCVVTPDDAAIPFCSPETSP